MKQMISFGTDGIRGNADLFPFTPSALFSIGQSLACWAQVYTKKQAPKILICGDTRISRERIINDLCNGLLTFPVTIVDAGILPTPALCQIMRKYKEYDVGIVVSASHNPYHDNGIKIFGQSGFKLTEQEESLLVGYFDHYLSKFSTNIKAIPVGDLFLWKSSTRTYRSIIESYFEANFIEGLVVVLDCAHGATSVVAQEIFESFGAKVIALADKPNGFNINESSGALHPDGLCQAVIDLDADIGFAFDGDGDRVIAVNKFGHVRDGDDILYQLLSLKEYQDQLAVVGTVMTNKGFELALNSSGRKLIRTKVGDKYVVSSLEKMGLLLGGESSGHIVLKNYLPTCDAIFCALMLIKSLKQTGNWSFDTFEKLPQVLINVLVKQKKDLTNLPYSIIIEEFEKMLTDGRLLVRYSGTENLLRVMAESFDQGNAHRIASQLAKKLQDALQI